METLAYEVVEKKHAGLLRFITAGSVDDGKSTLIGRLLYDSKSIFEDQLAALEQASQLRGEDGPNLALLTDGLRAEREQGITIDVAYRYFATPKRKFIIADCPGHIQYTRNMVTGASTANLAIVVVDARKGIIEQTCRHAFIASLLQIRHLMLCVNKMDLIDFDEERFEAICDDFRAFSSKLSIPDVRYLPISALGGDNVVERSPNMPWYTGQTLLDALETIEVSTDHNRVDARFPVQYVIRPRDDAHHDFRGYAGRIEGGVFRPGDQVVALPSGFKSRIRSIHLFDRELPEAFAPMSVTLLLEDELDIGRGDMLLKPDNEPSSEQDIELMLCWLNGAAMKVGGTYALKHTTRDLRCVIKKILYKVDITTLNHIEGDGIMGLNDIGCIQIRTTQPLHFDRYTKNRSTGSVILVDEFTNETVGAGMIL
jgi:sulfate adenylyltransferase subunit 1